MRQLLIDRVTRQGWTQAAAAQAAGLSVRTVAKWLGRARRGDTALEDGCSRPHRQPRRLDVARTAAILAVRQERATAWGNQPPRQIDPRPRHQRCQSFEQFHRIKHLMRRPIRRSAPQLKHYLPFGSDVQASWPTAGRNAYPHRHSRRSPAPAGTAIPACRSNPCTRACKSRGTVASHVATVSPHRLTDSPARGPTPQQGSGWPELGRKPPQPRPALTLPRAQPTWVSPPPTGRPRRGLGGVPSV
jgi:leucine-zipper of insertion element IS481